MSSTIGKKAQESAALRAEKRAAALRENLKRRKEQSATPSAERPMGKEDEDAKS